ncbi:hypothetical protein KVD19_07475 [Helicobacter pylori]|nr:hypothetical protein KVD19_07475 [Helicobacter pylori]
MLSPMFFDGKGAVATAIIITALAHAKDLNKHSDAEWSAMLDNRNTDECDLTLLIIWIELGLLYSVA